MLNEDQEENLKIMVEYLTSMNKELLEKKEELSLIENDIKEKKKEYNSGIENYKTLNKNMLDLEEELDKYQFLRCKIKKSTLLKIQSINKEMLNKYKDIGNQPSKKLTDLLFNFFNVKNFVNFYSFIAIKKNFEDLKDSIKITMDEKPIETQINNLKIKLKDLNDNENVPYPYYNLIEFVEYKIEDFDLIQTIEKINVKIKETMDKKYMNFIYLKKIESIIYKGTSTIKFLSKYMKKVHSLFEKYKRLKENEKKNNKKMYMYYYNDLTTSISDFKKIDPKELQIMNDNITSLTIRSEFSDDVSYYSFTTDRQFTSPKGFNSEVFEITSNQGTNLNAVDNSSNVNNNTNITNTNNKSINDKKNNSNNNNKNIIEKEEIFNRNSEKENKKENKKLNNLNINKTCASSDVNNFNNNDMEEKLQANTVCVTRNVSNYNILHNIANKNDINDISNINSISNNSNNNINSKSEMCNKNKKKKVSISSTGLNNEEVIKNIEQEKLNNSPNIVRPHFNKMANLSSKILSKPSRKKLTKDLDQDEELEIINIEEKGNDDKFDTHTNYQKNYTLPKNDSSNNNDKSAINNKNNAENKFDFYTNNDAFFVPKEKTLNSIDLDEYSSEVDNSNNKDNIFKNIGFISPMNSFSVRPSKFEELPKEMNINFNNKVPYKTRTKYCGTVHFETNLDRSTVGGCCTGCT